jgi:AcrR family transcriptional regulator
MGGGVTKAVPRNAKQRAGHPRPAANQSATRSTDEPVSRSTDARPPEGRPAARSPQSRRLHPTAQRILAAARRILTQRGYHGLTLQAIAIEADVNKAGVWYYFGGKEQLVLAMLEEIAVTESHHFGARPAADATLDERVDLILGSADQVKQRVERYVAF